MDIERLTKTQIVLLTLLVSFMTSIATGIVTVTLLDQAPPAVTQTINRVVERTVERVVPDKSQGASVVTTEKTVVVKESDLITESIDANSKHLVRIFRNSNPTIIDSKDEFISLGIVVSEDGIVATDGAVVLDGFGHFAVTAAGERFALTLAARDSENRVALLSMKSKELSEDGSAKPLSMKSASFGDLSALKLGTTVIALSGRERTNVAIGIVAGLEIRTVTAKPESEDAELKINETLNRIKTDIAVSDISLGSPLIDIFGEMVGIYTTRGHEGGGASYAPISIVEAALAELSQKPTSTTNTE